MNSLSLERVIRIKHYQLRDIVIVLCSFLIERNVREAVKDQDNCEEKTSQINRGHRLARFSVECRKTKLKTVTVAKHKGKRQYKEPIKT